MPAVPHRPYAAGLAALLLLAGCSGEDPAADPPASATPAPSTASSPSTGSATPTAPTGAAEVVADAVARLEQQNTGHYRSFVNIPGIQITEEGNYRLSPLAFDVTRVYQPVQDEKPVRSGNLTVRMILVDGRLWARFIDDEGDSGGSACYLALDGPVAEVPGLDIDNTQPPAAVAGALLGQATADRKGVLVGSTDLVTGIGLLGQRVVAALGVGQPIGARLPALFSVEDGRLVNWQTNLSQIAPSIRATGQPVPRFARLLARTAAPSAVFLNQGRLSGRPEGATTDGPIAPPDAGSVVTPADSSQAAIRAALADCPLD